MLIIDQFGQPFGIRFVANVPSAHRIEFVERRSWICLGHFCQSQVDGVGQDHCQQCQPVLGQRIGAQVRKMPGKIRPLID